MLINVPRSGDDALHKKFSSLVVSLLVSWFTGSLTS